MDLIILSVKLVDIITLLFYSFIVDPVTSFFHVSWFITLFTLLASPSIILLNATSTSTLPHSCSSSEDNDYHQSYQSSSYPSNNYRLRNLLVQRRSCRRCYRSRSNRDPPKTPPQVPYKNHSTYSNSKSKRCQSRRKRSNARHQAQSRPNVHRPCVG